jgi:hypothetical protein
MKDVEIEGSTMRSVIETLMDPVSASVTKMKGGVVAARDRLLRLL